MAESSPKGLKTLWEKGEIAHYEQFLFPVFSKHLYCRLVKARVCLGKGSETTKIGSHSSND